MKAFDSWFTFEGRCLLCGVKFSDDYRRGAWALHLKSHIREGYLNDELEQIKPHPVGFPGPPLGKQPPARIHVHGSNVCGHSLTEIIPCSRLTTQAQRWRV